VATLIESFSLNALRWLARGLSYYWPPPPRRGLKVTFSHRESSGPNAMPTNVYNVSADPPVDPAKVASVELSYRSGTDPATITTLGPADALPQLRVPFGLDYEVLLTDVSPAGERSDPATVTGTATEGGGGGGGKPATRTVL
jgi:hypothetical protein